MKVLFNNCGLKAVALIIAIVIFSYVHGYSDYRITQSFVWPVEVHGLADELALAGWSGEVAQARISLAGPVGSMRQLEQQRHALSIDCRGLTKAGSYVLPVTAPELADLQVVQIQPATVKLHCEKRAYREIAVNVERGALAAEGSTLVAQEVSPSHVGVSGPESLVAEPLRAVIRFEGRPLSDDTVLSLPVEIYTADGQRVDTETLRLDPPRIRYSAAVQPKAAVHVLPLLPDLRGVPPAGFYVGRVDVTPRSIAVSADKYAGKQAILRLEQFDLRNAEQSFRRRVRIIYPADLARQAALPAMAEVDVEVLAYDPAAAQRLQLDLGGTDPALEYVVSPAQLVLHAPGLRRLSARQRDAISAKVEVGALQAGEYRLTPQLQLAAGLEQFTLQPPSVLVTIIPAGSAKH